VSPTDIVTNPTVLPCHGTICFPCVHIHIDSLALMMRELLDARQVDDVARVVRERGGPLLGADDVKLIVGSDEYCADIGNGLATGVAIAPVRDSDPVAAICARWSTPHDATPEAQRVLNTIADAAALAIDNLRLSQAARSASADAAQSRRDSETLLATVGHELRQPLSAIVNAMATMQMRVDGDVSERARAIMARQVDQLRRITDDLLDAVQIQRGTLTLSRAPVDAARVVSDCVDAVRVRADHRHQRLTFASSEPALWMLGDGGRVRQIASNLLDNAVKYTPTGGTIDVSVKADGAWIVLCVRDSGRGIAPEHLPHVFESFFQERSGSGGSLGIGLSVVKRLTEAHGGHFEARSDGAGLGSAFTVRFPASARPASVAS
jgi:signal transduction histidine kinase